MSTEAVPPPDRKADEEEEAKLTFSFLDGVRIVAGLVLLSSLVSYMIFGNMFWNLNPWWAHPKAVTSFLKGPVVLTDAELLEFNGQDETKPVYLALNGTIFDVSAGRRTYAPGGPYHFFAGKDASRGYITGCFQEDAVADFRGAEWMFIPKDVPRFSEESDEAMSEQRRFYRYEEVGKGLKEVEGTLKHWAKVFRGKTGKEYFEIGHLKREEGWLDKLPLRPLCGTAENKRPKEAFDAEKVYKRSAYMKKVRQVQKWQLEDAKAEGEEKESVARDEL